MPNFSPLGLAVWPPIKNTNTQSSLLYRLAELPGFAQADFENFAIVVSFCHLKI